MCIRDSSESGCREGFVTSALAYYQSRAEDQPDAQVGEDNRDVPIEMDSLASTPDRRMTEGHEALQQELRRLGDQLAGVRGWQVRFEQHMEERMVKLERLIVHNLAQRTQHDKAAVIHREGSPAEGASDPTPDSLVTV
eukprot:TRINITY_DN4056_c0_g2_i1.p1 TRINITY_DN4056_c0_g2~~TRINITY_DN4056_c0_g2_i1.p1  ORF type:complete len:138 (+),score=35.52 TRINITY_DN4056_c0_g2_i1:138-551(+)